MEGTWTAERVEQLTRLWEEELTTAEIGRRLGLTKNAVIGKIHRLGLVPRIPPKPTPPVRNVFDFNGPSCMWPFGHPGDEDFHFCGDRPLPGKPYCANHAAVAYIRPKDNKSNAA